MTDNKKNASENEAKKTISINSVEKKLIGTWKLNYSSYLPIKLPNFSGDYKDLTLNLDSNRNAIFYLDNFKDSTAKYEWRAESSEITFQNGDVVSSSEILNLNDSLLTFIIIKVVEDTLNFRKL